MVSLHTALQMLFLNVSEVYNLEKNAVLLPIL